MHDLRVEVTDALTELPTLLARTRAALQIFQKSEELEQCSVDLYVATLEMLHHIIAFYCEKTSSE